MIIFVHFYFPFSIHCYIIIYRIKRKDNTIYFITEEQDKKAIPIEDIERLHLFGEVDLNTKFLNYISKYSVLIR